MKFGWGGRVGLIDEDCVSGRYRVGNNFIGKDGREASVIFLGGLFFSVCRFLNFFV